jgi:hypothetical protein
MFSFCKYATIIFPSLECVAYIKDPRAERDGWLSPACSLCKGSFQFLYREKAECVRPVQSEFPCTVYVRQPPTLKGAASDVAFRYILNLQAFSMDSRVPFDRFKYIVLCGRVGEPNFSLYTALYYDWLVLQERRGIGITVPSEMSVYEPTPSHRL